LLEDDDDQKDLVLIGLLALEDPGGSGQGATCTAGIPVVECLLATCSACQAVSIPCLLHNSCIGEAVCSIFVLSCFEI
jgi:hypothetical protein